MARKKRALKTHCIHGHEYTPENTMLRPETEHRSWQRICRTCHNIKSKKRREEHPEYFRAYRKRNPELKTTANYNHRLRNYGITPEQYQEMWDAQEGLCAIVGCGRIINCVDHCHDTGFVRGLLCRQCNTGLGFLNDDPNLMLNAMVYVVQGRINFNLSKLTKEAACA